MIFIECDMPTNNQINQNQPTILGCFC